LKRRVIVGGLGGGGDVGLASMIVEGFRLSNRVAAVVSFNRCLAGGPRGVGVRVKGALARVECGSDLGRRVFEDKLCRIADWAREAYLLCVEEPWKSILEGLEWAVERFSPDCIISADIGGDGVLLGYESMLGSYTTDAVARAALAWASREYSLRAIVAAGGIGAEGGGRELSPAELYATISYLAEKGVVIGGWTPEPQHAATAHALLTMAESGMLPLYLAAVEGRSRVTVRQAYLSGVYEVKPWYKHVLFFDAARMCELSPLCAEASKGKARLRKWRRPKPPQDYARLLKHALKLAKEGRIERELTMLVERLAAAGKQTPPALLTSGGAYILLKHVVRFASS